MTDRNQLISDLAEVLAGLQAPRSLPHPFICLGVGLDAYDRILHRRGFGWAGKEEFEMFLKKELADAS